MPDYSKDSLTELGPATDADLAIMGNHDLVDALICECSCHEHTRYKLTDIYAEVMRRLGHPMGKR
jgi:hypothetical protein